MFSQQKNAFFPILAIALSMVFSLIVSSRTPSRADTQKDSPREQVIEIVSPKEKDTFQPREEITVKGRVVLPENGAGFETITVMIVQGKSDSEKQKMLGSFALNTKTQKGAYNIEATLKTPKNIGRYFIYAQGIHSTSSKSQIVNRTDSPFVEIEVKK